LVFFYKDSGISVQKQYLKRFYFDRKMFLLYFETDVSRKIKIALQTFRV